MVEIVKIVAMECQNCHWDCQIFHKGLSKLLLEIRIRNCQNLIRYITKLKGLASKVLQNV